MKFINITNNTYPVFLKNIKEEFPSVIFPEYPTKEDLLPFGYVPVLPTDRPKSTFWKESVELPPIEHTDGYFYQQWELRDIERSEEEIEKYFSDKKQELFILINQKKNIKRDSGFLVPVNNESVLFDSDYSARTAYIELNNLFVQNPNMIIRWKASDSLTGGNWVDMDLSLFQLVSELGRIHIQNCFNWQEQKQILVNSIQSDEDILIIFNELNSE